MDRELLAAQLRAVLIALREDLKPELTSGQAKLRADLMDMLIGRLAATVDRDESDQSFWLDIAKQIDAVAADDPAQRARIAATVAAAAKRDHADRSVVETRIADLGKSSQGQHRSAAELVITPETFTAYLRKRFPDNASLEAIKLTTVPGGRSKGTILVEYLDRGQPRDLVIRKDFETSTTGTSVSYEFPIVRTAWDAGLPVPEPKWLEDDPQALGGRFIAFSKMPGKSMGSLFDSNASPAYCRSFAAGLARVHTLDIKSNGLLKKLSYGNDAHPVRAMLEQFHARYLKDLAQIPLMDAAFAWLRSQLDTIGNHCMLVHGDAGLHNTLGDNDRLTALLDWEFSHAGDPAEDLAYCKFLIQRLTPWPDFMTAYRDAGGPEISDARIRFFSVWRTLLLSVMTGNARAVFDSKRDQDLRIAYIGYNTLPRQLRDLAGDLAAAAEGALSP
jgi:aminoglycoside phosphotransferase (APT) family kinase protein